MTNAQTEQIEKLRRENYSYRFIGQALRLSPNTVKSVCRRKGFEAIGARKTKAEKMSANFCKNCGLIISLDAKSNQSFCSDACRRSWWKKNRKVTQI